jgi:diguanylate cyclase (GGDEF)-like protein
VKRVEEAASGNGRWLDRLYAWSGQHPERPASMTRGEPVILRFIAPLALLVVAATIVCSGLGLVLAKQADDYLEASHRQALRGAIEAMQAASPDLAHGEPQLVRMLERASGLKELRFESDPPVDGRDVQSLTDSNGRIIGWFSWEAERPATAMMLRLLPFGALIAVGLLTFAGLAVWQLRRLGFLLARSEQAVHKLAHEDPVTGLSNQRHLFELLDDLLSARSGGEVLAVALVDLGGFDDMKDALGNAEENGVLVEVANRLRDALPDGTAIGRLGGDRFGLIFTVANVDEAVAIAETAREAVSRALWLDKVVQITANVGLAVAPQHGTRSGELRHRADLALRTARRRGRGLAVAFTPDMEAEFEERSFIKRELSRALATRAFDVHYQPIVQADGGNIVGVEALLRWNHPSRGFIPPGVFVRVAEDAGLMEQLGEFVLRRALADAERWPDLHVAVNLSPVQVRDRRFVDLVASVLAETKIEPSRVVLEITESVLIDDPDTAKSRLEDLRALGVKLALDDFGAGYSSLSYLQRLPFDKLKIDRGFVTALDQSANAGVIIQAIVALGRALGMVVLIEGVETEEQRVLMRLAGCNEMQGYLFAKPAPREEIDRLLAAANAKPDVRSAG